MPNGNVLIVGGYDENDSAIAHFGSLCRTSGICYANPSANNSLPHLRLHQRPVAHRQSLGDISTRIQVGTGNDVLIAGFIVSGTQPKKIITRATGPSLPFSGTLANPFLELRDSSGTLIKSDNYWRTGGQEQEIVDTMIPPTNDLESAIGKRCPRTARHIPQLSVG